MAHLYYGETIRGIMQCRYKKVQPEMDRFLQHEDDTGQLIQARAAELYNKLKTLDPDGLGLPAHCLYYYKASHANRLFFSIETSAHLLYKSIRLSGKEPGQTVIMDYGA